MQTSIILAHAGGLPHAHGGDVAVIIVVACLALVALWRANHWKGGE